MFTTLGISFSLNVLIIVDECSFSRNCYIFVHQCFLNLITTFSYRRTPKRSVDQLNLAILCFSLWIPRQWRASRRSWDTICIIHFVGETLTVWMASLVLLSV